MKRYVLDMAYRHGEKGTELDLYEVPEGDWVKYEDTEELRAEVERLRTLTADRRKMTVQVFERAMAAESRLATAQELLIEAADGHAENPHWVAKYQAFLAKQPAAPEPRRVYGGEGFPDVILDEPAAPLACPDCGGPLTPGRLLPDTLRCERCAQPAAETDHLGRPMTYWGGQPAAPPRTEAEPSLWCDNCEEPMAREGDNPAGVCDVCWGSYQADKAVLAAMAEIDLGVLEAIRDKQSCAPLIFHPPCLAELARRKLKP